MTKYQKEEVFNKIKRKVFIERSEQIKNAKLEGKNFAKEVQNPMLLSGPYHNLNAYNLDNNDLDYIVFKKYLLKLYGFEKLTKKVVTNDISKKQPKRCKTARRQSTLINQDFYDRLSKKGTVRKRNKK